MTHKNIEALNGLDKMYGLLIENFEYIAAQTSGKTKEFYLDQIDTLQQMRAATHLLIREVDSNRGLVQLPELPINHGERSN